MRNVALRWGAGVLLALACAQTGLADARVGGAATDPTKIAGLVAAMPATECAGFIKDVVVASSRLPVPPEKRVARVADVIGAGLTAVANEARAEVLATALCAVPFTLLPATVDALAPQVRALTETLDAIAFDAFAVKVVAAVDSLPLPAEDKTVYMTFAIVLLGRAAPQERLDEVIQTAFQAVPEAYRAAVEQMVAAALRGDYTAVFGPGAGAVIMVQPKEPQSAVVQMADYWEREEVLRTVDETIFIDVGIERPSIPTGEGESPAEPEPNPTVPVPPVPPPYLGQWR